MSDVSNPGTTRPDAYAYSGDAKDTRPSDSHCNGDAARDQAINAWRPDTSNSDKAVKWREENKATWDKPLELNKDGTYTVKSNDDLDSIAERELKMMGKAVNKQAIEEEAKHLIHLNDKHHPTLDSNPQFLGNGWHLKLSISGRPNGDSGTGGTYPDQGIVSQNPDGTPYVPGRDPYGYGGPDQTYGQLPQGSDPNAGLYPQGSDPNAGLYPQGYDPNAGLYPQGYDSTYGQYGQYPPNYYYGDNYWDPSQSWYQPGGILPIPFFGGNGWNRQHQYYNGNSGHQQLVQSGRSGTSGQNYETTTSTTGTTASNGSVYTRPNTSNQYSTTNSGRTTNPYSGTTTNPYSRSTAGRGSVENTGSTYTYGQPPGSTNTRTVYQPSTPARSPYTVTQTAPQSPRNVHIAQRETTTTQTHKT